MPLTSAAKVYKNFPLGFADRVTQHVKRRTESYKQLKPTDDKHDGSENNDNINRKENLKKKHEPSVDTSSSQERPSVSKRPRTPLSAIVDSDTDHDKSMSSSSSGPSPRGMSPMATGGVSPSLSTRSPSGPSPLLTNRDPSPSGHSPCLSSRNPSPAGFRPISDSPTKMEVDDRSSSPWQLTPRGRGRTTPRTTVSLDNVDLWEESDSENEQLLDDFDQINGLIINPRKTFDFSELRNNSRSPLTTARQRLNKVLRNPSPKGPKADHPKPKPSEKPRHLPELKKKDSKCSAGSTKPRFSENPRQSEVVTKPRVRLPPEIKSILFSEKQYQRLNCDTSPEVAGDKPLSGHSATNKHSSKLTELTRSLRRPQTSQRRISQMDCDMPESSKLANSPNESRNTQDRKVKFNNFVTVCDGEVSSTDMLRNSHNSAQMFKQKYLAPRRSAKYTAIPALDVS